MRRLVFTPEAFDDLQRARDWYENRRAGLGTQFLVAIETALEQVSRAPDGYRLLEGRFRRAVVRRFPYHLYFTHDDQQITVLLVFHTAQDPAKVLGRLPSH
ncbi:MAG: type II toxin-antitoxin system RelE/ParE family toxin [Aquincola sp.]|uniref:type II toxin-antitoxin system RelE/ParE family toxin n=1 Tax=uncultured Aquincola sp. TaxID=886556 RepID=UPI0032B22716|nr:type II toxin-antitoxin system RelE/ParE family toxin [Aquincola sp.]|tara:strand:- start:525 stop:827 length:303 start_codon:yes stop_codon:yes gene_type:complete